MRAQVCWLGYGAEGLLRHLRAPGLNAGVANDTRHLRPALEALSAIMRAVDKAPKSAAPNAPMALLASTDYSRVRLANTLACVEGAYWQGVEEGLFPPIAASP